MRRLLPAIALTFFLAVSPAAHPAEVSCLDYGDPSQSYAAQARSEKNTDKAPSSNAKPNKNPFDQFDDIPVPCVEGLLRGQIVGGDYENVVRLFRDSHPVLRKFSLISPGGSVEEAIRIGRLFRKYAITARAPFRFFNGSFEAFGPHAATLLCAGSSESVCASACVLIWFGAVDRWGTVGLHRPHADDPAFRAMTPSEASVAYGRMLDSVRKYLDEMEVPKQLIESMVATGSAEIRWADAVEDNVRRPHAEWYRLYKLPKPQKNKPWKFKHLTIEHVYEPLAKSNGKIYELTQVLRAASNERWKRLHQFLSDIGVKALRTQLGQTLGIAQVSDNIEQYEANIQRAFGSQKDLFRQ
jgi:hypothetical protein